MVGSANTSVVLIALQSAAASGQQVKDQDGEGNYEQNVN
jgi:hypothetical protein